VAQVFYTSLKHWIDVQTSTAGVATFAPIDAQGDPVFSSIVAQQFTAEANTSVLNSAPLASLKAVSPDLKAITVNVGVGAVIGVLGAASIVAAPNGTRVHAHIMGT
jgi:hypothetical protein